MPYKKTIRGLTMKLFTNLKRILSSLYLSIKRFPVTLILAAIVTVFTIIITEYSSHRSDDFMEILSRVTMVIGLGIPISLSIKFIFERFGSIKNITKVMVYFTAALLLLAYYFLMLPNFEMVAITRYIALIIVFCLGAILIPYFFRKDKFELYVIKLMLRFFVTFIFSVVLQLGISAILLTIDSLLGIDIYGKLYLYIWYIICGVFAPAFFLAGVPLSNQELEASEYPKVLKVLLLYIVMPLISAYTFILYLYFAKVLITFKWPVGLVGHLVLWYSVISIFVIFLVYPLIGESRWVKGFAFWFPKLILPLIIMMFVSVGIRVKAYGITENRYFVLALAIWVLGTMFYWNLSRHKINLILPLSLATIAFLSVMGPWSAYSVSVISQNSRLEGILNRYNMIKDKTISIPSSAVAKEDKKEITEILRYFNNSHSLEDVKVLPDNFELKDMKNVFGFEYDDYYPKPDKNNFFTYSLNFVSSPHNISGFDYLFNFRYPGNTEIQSAEKIKAEYNRETNEFKLYYNNVEVYKKLLHEYADILYEKYGTNPDKTIAPEEMTFTDENSNVRVNFLFINIYGSKNSTEDTTKIDSMEFDVLVDIKVEQP